MVVAAVAHRGGSLWLALTVGVCVGCTQAPEPCGPALDILSSPALVSRDGTAFRLGDAPFVPAGANAYWVLDAARHGRMDRVEALFDDVVAHGVTVLRIWAFDLRRGAPIHREDGTLDEAALLALDQVFAAASQRGLRLLPTLSNHWSDYGGIDVYAGWAGVAPGAEALASEQVRGNLAFYGRALAGRTNRVTGHRYADDPTVFGWDLINELRCDGCPPGLASEFLADIASRVREVDPNHLIGAGDEGFVGEHGVDVGTHAATGELDWVSAHVWPQRWRTLPNANGDHADVAVRAVDEGRRWIVGRHEIAQRHGLPLLVGEMGWHDELGGDARRAIVVGAWVEEAHRRGAGALIWQWGDAGFRDTDGYTVREGDDAANILCR